MAQWVGAQGQVKVGKNIPLVAFPPENPHQKRKKFVLILTTWFAESVEGLNSSLAQSPGDIWLQSSAWNVVFTELKGSVMLSAWPNRWTFEETHSSCSCWHSIFCQCRASCKAPTRWLLWTCGAYHHFLMGKSASWSCFQVSRCIPSCSLDVISAVLLPDLAFLWPI